MDKKKLSKIIFLLILFLVIGIILFITSFKKIDEKEVKYTADSDITYELYDSDGNKLEDTTNISNVKTMKLFIKYNFNTDKKEDLSYVYKINGILKLNKDNTDNDTNSSIQQTYAIVDEKEVEVLDDDNYLLEDTVSIDLTKYYDFVKEWSSSDLSGELVLNVEVQNKNELINDLVTSKISIPFDKTTDKIKVVNGSLDNSYKIDSYLTFKLNFKSVISIILCVVNIILLILSLINLFKNSNGKSKYELFIDDILNKYNSNLIFIEDMPEYNKYNITKVNSIDDLFNKNDKVNYLKMTAIKKTLFYVILDNNLYLYQVNEDDFK